MDELKDVVVCMGCVHSVHGAAVEAGAEWQSLFSGGSNSPTCGAVVHVRGADFTPAVVTVNGLPARVLVQHA